MSKLVYIASPYSHEDPEIRRVRFLAVRRREDLLVSKGVNAYSPIAHNHERALRGTEPPQGWIKWDLLMLARADVMEVLMIEGWRESVGIRDEMAFAGEHRIPIRFAFAGEDALVQFYLGETSE